MLAFITEHYEELVEQRRPRAQAAAKAVRAKAQEVIPLIDDYLREYAFGVSLTEPLQTRDGRDVPGIEAAVDSEAAAGGD